MSQKHYGQGSQFPPHSQKGIRIYSMRFCPYAERARLVAAAKNIEAEVINIRLNNKPDWYLELNKTGKVPAIQHDGDIIFDSMIIVDYLDDAFEGRKLNPSKPYERAKNRMLCELFSRVPGAFYKIFSNLDGVDKQEWWENVQVELEFLENELVERGTTFYGGSEATLLDYLIWPWFERFEAVPILHPELKALSSSRFPKLTSWVSHMKEDTAVKSESLSPEIHAEFIKTIPGGNPNYDLGL